MSEFQAGSRYSELESRVAVWVDRRFSSVRPMKGLFRSYRTKNRTRFSADAQEFFDEVLALNCPLGHLPTELQEAPYDEGLEMFQRTLWKVVGTLVESDPSLTPQAEAREEVRSRALPSLQPDGSSYGEPRARERGSGHRLTFNPSLRRDSSLVL